MSNHHRVADHEMLLAQFTLAVGQLSRLSHCPPFPGGKAVVVGVQDPFTETKYDVGSVVQAAIEALTDQRQLLERYRAAARAARAVLLDLESQPGWAMEWGPDELLGASLRAALAALGGDADAG